MSVNILYYVYDPMCSWCYAFKPVLARLRQQLPEAVQLQAVLGGLAADTQEPMSEALRAKVQQSWRSIEQRMPQVRFNFNFWHTTTPIRSTYPSCRAVLVAGLHGLADEMLAAIQQSYYHQAENPALLEVLAQCAERIGLVRQDFLAAMQSPAIEAALQAELQLTRQLGASSFPALILDVDGSRWPVLIDYQDESLVLEEIQLLLSMACDE